MIQPHSVAAELATADVVLVQYANGTMDLIPDHSAACKTCGLCSAIAPQPEKQLLRQPTPGQQTPMRLEFPVKSLMSLALGLYGMPLIGLLAGALLATAFGANDAGALIGSVTGCAIALAIMRALAGTLERRTVARLQVSASGAPETL